MSCPPGSERSFGPQVDTRCREFDFTLQFEDIFLVLLPSVLFIFIGLWQTIHLYRISAAYSVRSFIIRGCKTITFSVITATQIVILILRARNDLVQTDVSLAADILAPVATVVAFLLSSSSHRRTLRPSTPLGLYLSLITIANISRTRTLWLLAPGGPVAIMMTVTLSLTLLALLLESIEERKGLSLGAPEEYSGIWTRTTFSWLIPTLKLGYSHDLSLDDLPALDSNLESRVLRRQLISTWDKYDQHERNSLMRASLQSFLPSFLSAVLPRLLVTAFTFAQPFLINTTINFMSEKHPDVNHGKGLIGAWALVYLGIAISHSIYRYQATRFIARLRGGLIALVYQRCLNIRAVDAGDITAVALMGTDIERIATGMQMLHEAWGALLDISIACWLLEREIFLACIAPIALVLMFIAATSRISLAAQNAQRQWIEKVQERLSATSTLLGDIKAIKMLGLSKVTATILTRLRMDEIKTSKWFRELLVATLMLSLTPINLAPVITFLIYIIIALYWTHGSLLTAQAFTSIALITLLTSPVIVFVQSIPRIIQSVSSFDRIQEYCNYSNSALKDGNYYEPGTIELRAESEVDLPTPEGHGDPTDASLELSLSVNKESFGWDKTSPPVLRDVEVSFKRGSFTAVIGPVGSGKSAFLKSLLGEMVSLASPRERKSPAHRKPGLMAYCAQEPWLENATVRQNIISIYPFNILWYREVLASCSLDTDIQQLPRGDLTRVGSKGLNLSGGQKQRIALARAVYSKKRIILLDDVFSGMDAHTIDLVSKRLLSRQGLLREHKTTVIFATHHRKIMPFADNIILLGNGTIVANDDLTSLSEQEGFINRPELGLVSDDENGSEATEATKVSPTQEAFDVAAEVSAEIAEETEGRHTHIRHKKGEFSIYGYYLRNSGWLAFTFYIIGVLGWVFCMEFSNVWMKWWSAANEIEPNRKVWGYFGIYALLGVLGTLGACICAWSVFISMISRSAAQLHSILLVTTLQAPFGYFSATDTGELLNRFSRDMELIDMELPSNMVNYTSTLVSYVAKNIILAVFSRFLAITNPIFAIFVYFLQSFYLQTSRQVRLLAIEAQAPLYTHFGESVAGAVTIRAFGWQSYHQERNYRVIDASQRPTYLQSCIQHWLGFMLELMVAALAVLLLGTMLIWRDNYTPGGAGVTLVTVVGFSEVLVRLVATWTRLEPSLGAIARVKKFEAETESEEKKDKTTYVPASWPQDGAIDIAGMTASYSTDAKGKPVLSGVSLSIKPGQHVAVCGRTGSGKTSLILSLLQMLDITEGSISIDGVDLSTLSCTDVRSRLNVVPQDPFLIPGTIRFNIDPFHNASDEDITYALERVRLLSIVNEQGGLDGEIDATAWSMGQKQLICFARAMIKKSSILILDEAMSSVDADTEATMQEVIDSDFKNCTVLAVMHRLEHIRNYDVAILMADGKVLESGDPRKLMKEDSRFSELYWLNAN